MINIEQKRKEFDSIFRTEYPRMLRLAVSILDDEELGHDIVSDVFLSLWDCYGTVDACRMRSYLLVSVKNRCISHLRKEARIAEYNEDYLRICDELYSDEDDMEKIDSLVETMMEYLGEPTRSILTDCYIKRMKYAEVAQKRGISMSTVKKHIMKALKTLRNMYYGMSVKEAIENELE